MKQSFALTISDASTDDMLEERIEVLAALAYRFPSMGSVRVRDDAMDFGLFYHAAKAAYDLGLRVVIESDQPDMLADTPGYALSSPGGDQEELVRIAADRCAGVVITEHDPAKLMRLAAMAEQLECPWIALNPDVRSMKDCHESVTGLLRDDRLNELPITVSAWSGEYALAVASVAVMDGADLITLDDLDLQACEVLDDLIRSGIRSPRMPVRPAYRASLRRRRTQAL